MTWRRSAWTDGRSSVAKWVLVAFEDDADADNFISFANNVDAKEYIQFGTVDAVFKKPTKFCECDPNKKSGKVGVRGSRYGWFLCGNCRRPVRGGGQVVYNLLEDEAPPWRKVFHLQVHASWSGRPDLEPRYRGRLNV
jgi:hypothetical protein